ncbi:MAG: hypothetical protein KBS93_08775 [Flavobacteriaceae bacterium]|nr:hypothetical protein [Candidatus Onthonaster equi]
MKIYIVLLPVLILFTNCEQPKNTSTLYKNNAGEITIGKNFVVDRPMAILIIPTEESLKETEKEIGSDNYRIYYDDGASIMNDANTVIETNNIESIEKLNNEIITFVTIDGKIYDVDLRDKAFVTLLFNGKEAPKELFSDNLETDEQIIDYMQ